MLSSLLVAPPTAKEKREEKEAARLYRQEQVAKLNDIKSRITAYRDVVIKEDIGIGIYDQSGAFIPYENAIKEPSIHIITPDDRVFINTYIERVIREVGKKNEGEMDAYLEVEMPKIRSMESALSGRVTLFVLMKVFAGFAANIKKDIDSSNERLGPSEKVAANEAIPLMLDCSNRISKWLADDNNRFLGADEVAAAMREFVMSFLKEVEKNKKIVGFIKGIIYDTCRQISGLLLDELKSVAVSAEVVQARAPSKVDGTKLAMKTFFICVFIGLAITAGMLAANDAIFRPLGFRLLNFVYAGGLFVVTLPYYLVRWFRNKTPHIYSMLPIYKLTAPPETLIGRYAASLFSYTEDDYYRTALAEFKKVQDAMSS